MSRAPSAVLRRSPPLLLLALSGVARAASLDQLEVGGPLGTPGASDATALWWNPAGLAGERGTRFVLEGAPTLANVQFVREGESDTRHQYRLFGTIPFAGVVSDVGVDGLGLGLGVAVPYARGAEDTAPDDQVGGGRYAIRSGMIQSAHVIGGAAYRPHPMFAFGATAQLALSQWTADLDSETLTHLKDRIEAEGVETDYDPSDIEDTRYSTRLRFSPLHDTAVTWSLGARVMPHEMISINAAFVAGYRVDNQGDVALEFQCPPQSDTYGRFGAEDLGLCYSTILADATVGYRLPWRIQGGIQVKPDDRVTLELMGGLVGWDAFSDYEVSIHGVAAKNPGLSEEAVHSVEQERLWARGAQNSGWVAVDGKFELGSALLGARVLYDTAAIPDVAMSPNNYDANEVAFTGLVGVAPSDRAPGLRLVLSGGHHLLATRTVTDNGFRTALDAEDRPEDRFNYPQMNGTYGARITRFGIGVQGRFGTEPDVELPSDPLPVAPIAPEPELPPSAVVVPELTDAERLVAEAPDPSKFPWRLLKEDPELWLGTPLPRYEVNPLLEEAQRFSNAQFISRLCGAWGLPPRQEGAGFVYGFRDEVTGQRVQALGGAAGPNWLVDPASGATPEAMALLRELDAWIASAPPGRCVVQWDGPTGRTRAGFEGGEFVEGPVGAIDPAAHREVPTSELTFRARPQPARPEGLAKNVAGTCSVRVVADDSGEVVMALPESCGAQFVDSALAAARETTIEPFVLDGSPVFVTFVLNYAFSAE